MRHLHKGRKFGRKRDQRRAFLKSLASSFFIWGRIKTTEARAKEMRPFVERLLTRAKTPTLADRRILRRFLGEHAVENALRRAELLKERKGGYTRIVKAERRKSDGAEMAIIELVK